MCFENGEIQYIAAFLVNFFFTVRCLMHDRDDRSKMLIIVGCFFFSCRYHGRFQF